MPESLEIPLNNVNEWLTKEKKTMINPYVYKGVIIMLFYK